MITIFVNGTFDIIHRGHINLLNFAKGLGTKLYVGIDSDARVKHLKGLDRPINNELDRKFLLQNLKAVDLVSIFHTNEELEKLVFKLQPDIMVVGEEYKNKEVIGSQFARALYFFPRIEHYSTTKTIKDIGDRRDLQ